MPSLTNQQTASPGPLNNNKRGFWAKKFPDTRKERSDRWQVIASALFLSNDLRQKKTPRPGVGLFIRRPVSIQREWRRPRWPAP